MCEHADDMGKYKCSYSCSTVYIQPSGTCSHYKFEIPLNFKMLSIYFYDNNSWYEILKVCFIKVVKI